ncbi:MAG TPA: SDR family oxidoreductase [Gaiellaceae bacterium]|nr:SDR family oxidoreductase [Gaiellaceae bacterium]
MLGLQGRTALVTGGSRGIGRAACLGFARAGADVAVHYRSQAAEAEEVAAEIRALGRRATVVQADVTRPGEVRRALDDVARFAGPAGLHVLFNNAGVYPPGTLESLTVEEWDRVFAVNARGPFLVTQAALPLLTAAAEARVINIGTVMVHRGAPGNLHYAAAKASLIGLTRVLARELAPRGITVNLVVPSMVGTETAERDYPGVAEAIVADQAIRRFQQPDDLVGLLCFLASPESGFVTGQTILADGGRAFL